MYSNLLSAAGQAAARIYGSLALDMNTEYQGPLPTGAKILAANHPTTTDPFIMMGLAPEPVHVLITGMCFNKPLLGRFLQGAGHIPVTAGNGPATLDKALGLLAAGKTVGIFPEGALSPLEGTHSPAHTGVARLALASGAPVVPCGIALEREHIRFMEASDGRHTETARIYMGGAYYVTVGRPLYLTGSIGDRSYVREASGQVMAEVMRMARTSARRMSVARDRLGALVPAMVG